MSCVLLFLLLFWLLLVLCVSGGSVGTSSSSFLVGGGGSNVAARTAVGGIGSPVDGVRGRVGGGGATKAVTEDATSQGIPTTVAALTKNTIAKHPCCLTSIALWKLVVCSCSFVLVLVKEYNMINENN